MTRYTHATNNDEDSNNTFVYAINHAEELEKEKIIQPSLCYHFQYC